jgi:hypothetical protein
VLAYDAISRIAAYTKRLAAAHAAGVESSRVVYDEVTARV